MKNKCQNFQNTPRVKLTGGSGGQGGSTNDEFVKKASAMASQVI